MSVNPTELMVLLSEPLESTAAELRAQILRFAPELVPALVNVGADPGGSGFAVEMNGADFLLECADESYARFEELAAAIDHAPYDAVTKNRAKGHAAWLRLRLLGDDPPSLDRFALTLALAGSFIDNKAIAVANLRARASLPIAALAPDSSSEGRLAILRAYPLGLLFTGFMKYELEDQPGVWMVSVCAADYGLPEFCLVVADHSWGQRSLDIFDLLHRHALSKGAVFNPGDSATLPGQTRVRFVLPDPSLPFLVKGRQCLQLLLD